MHSRIGKDSRIGVDGRTRWVALTVSVMATVALILTNPASAQAAVTTMTPAALTTSSGSVGAGQPVTNLAVRDQSGTADIWSRYVEFSGTYSGYLTYTLPGGLAASAITGVSVQVNYRGPAVSTQTWTFSMRDFRSNSWVPVGTNATAPDWGAWKLLTFAVSGTASNYVSPNRTMQLRIVASNASDAADVDYAAIRLTTTATPDPTAGGLPAPVACPGCWHPPVRTSWNWVISKVPQAPYRPVAVYDIDGFEATQADVRALHGAGKKVVCYLSVGSSENWRPDAAQFPSTILGRNLDGWPGERWLDIRDVQRSGSVLARIMNARMDMCDQKGFDAIEFDSMDGYTNVTGFPLTAKDQAFYNVFLANGARIRGMSAVMKNDVEQITELLPYFDMAINESCAVYQECAQLSQFVKAGKPVFHAEYGSSMSFCTADNAANINGVRFARKLDDSVFQPCR